MGVATSKSLQKLKWCEHTASMVFLSTTNMPNTLTPIGSPFSRLRNTLIYWTHFQHSYCINVKISALACYNRKLLIGWRIGNGKMLEWDGAMSGDRGCSLYWGRREGGRR